MPHPRDNYIYKYDPKHERVITIDSVTGEVVDPTEDRLTSLLKYLHRQNRSVLLRKFAIWCTRQPEVSWKPVVYHMIRTAEDHIHGESTKRELLELYEETEGMAISTDTVGLRRGNLHAPLFLAARASINPDPYLAAREAARYHSIWADMAYNYIHRSHSAEEIGREAAEVAAEATKQQIDHLLELMTKEHE